MVAATNRRSAFPAATNRRSCSRALIEQNAGAVMLDEPTKGVDIGAKSESMRSSADWADEDRCVIVVSSKEGADAQSR
jgi:ABC-type sugar transport system ATPase subunit